MAEEATAAPKKKGKLKVIILGLVALLVVGGAGAGGAIYLTGGLHAGAHEEEIDEDMPQLNPKAEVSEEAVKEAKRKARQNGRPDPRVFQATYIPIEDPFTANLSGGENFVQVGIGLSTYYDAKVTEHVETHKMAIRSAILMVLSETDPVDVQTFSGKTRLKAALKNAVNDVLTNREGFGGIDDVYFTSFVAQ